MGVKCKSIDCNKFATYNLATIKKPEYCSEHKNLI